MGNEFLRHSIHKKAQELIENQIKNLPQDHVLVEYYEFYKEYELRKKQDHENVVVLQQAS